MNNDEQLRYPIGKFVPQEIYKTEDVQANIVRIERIPSEVERIVASLTPKQIDTPYRDGGWTARQVVHHMADSHMNAYVRFKWTLTEATPVIKAYNEKAWAETAETILDPVISISFLKALHQKWTALLRFTKAEDLKKEFIHPETKKHISLERLIALYAWHGEHHCGHLRIIAPK